MENLKSFQKKIKVPENGVGSKSEMLHLVTLLGAARYLVNDAAKIL